MDTVFLDEESEVTKDKAKYVYYRFVELKDGLYFVKDYYRNGTLQSTSSYKDPEMKTEHGYFVQYDSTGEKTMEGPFVNGKQHGDWVAYNRPCDELFVDDSVHYENGEGQGRSTKWEHATHKLIAVGNLLNSMTEGEWVVYYLSGTKRIVRHQKQDIDNGHYIEYEDITGNVLVEGDYNNGVEVGAMHTFFRSGVPYDSASIIVHYDSIFRRALLIEFDSATHKRAREVEMLNRKFDGKWTEYCSDTNLVSAVYTCKADKRNGPFKSYSCYGDHYLESEGTYKDDKLEGKVRHYYTDGKLRKEEQFKNDVSTGETKEYYYNDKGQIERTEESIINPTLKETLYKNGAPDSINLYSDNGLIRSYKVAKPAKRK